MINPEARYKDLLGEPYNYQAGPDQENGNGMNCQRFVHEFFELHGIHLPKWLKSKEIYEDRTYFRNLSGQEIPEYGDVFIFGVENETNPKRFHLAVYIGVDENGNHTLMHANRADGFVNTWRLEQFLNHSDPRYRRLQAIKRYSPTFDSKPNLL